MFESIKHSLLWGALCVTTLTASVALADDVDRVGPYAVDRDKNTAKRVGEGSLLEALYGQRLGAHPAYYAQPEDGSPANRYAVGRTGRLSGLFGQPTRLPKQGSKVIAPAGTSYFDMGSQRRLSSSHEFVVMRELGADGKPLSVKGVGRPYPAYILIPAKQTGRSGKRPTRRQRNR